MRFRVLLIQGGGKAFALVSEFEGQLVLTLDVVQTGRPTMTDFPGAAISGSPAASARIKLTYYQRLKGWVDVSPGTTVQSVMVEMLQNGKIKASQSFPV